MPPCLLGGVISKGGAISRALIYSFCIGSTSPVHRNCIIVWTVFGRRDIRDAPAGEQQAYLRGLRRPVAGFRGFLAAPRVFFVTPRGFCAVTRDFFVTPRNFFAVPREPLGVDARETPAAFPVRPARTCGNGATSRSIPEMLSQSGSHWNAVVPPPRFRWAIVKFMSPMQIKCTCSLRAEMQSLA